MTDLIMKDGKLKKRCAVFGEQMKPMATAMLKRQTEQHNDLMKLKELVEGIVGDMKGDYPIEHVTDALAQQAGQAIGMIIRAVDALGQCDGIADGALKRLKDWSKDIQKLGDPNIVFAPPAASKIIQPNKGIVQAKLKVVKKGGDGR